VRELLTKGATGGHLFFTTDDCRKTYTELARRASSSPRSRPSDRTASTAGCAIRSATIFGSRSRYPLPRQPRARRRDDEADESAADRWRDRRPTLHGDWPDRNPDSPGFRYQP